MCDGKFHWGKVTRKDTLVAVSDAHHEDIPTGRTARTTYHLVPIRTLESAVTPSRTDDAVDAQAAVASPENETGLDPAKAGAVDTVEAPSSTAAAVAGNRAYEARSPPGNRKEALDRIGQAAEARSAGASADPGPPRKRRSVPWPFPWALVRLRTPLDAIDAKPDHADRASPDALNSQRREQWREACADGL
ncbi:hypothetical protein GCM10010448_66000 [Streptomyces glomeratus]|uniref:Uncharacterized protein n=1 Tax=Streptomyces glomeratus TaxID=284452 RepID=A0ABP6M514_9ACTN